MPTGYTAPVADGEITELEDFALTVARGWGALVLLRDSDQSLEATRRYIERGAYLNGGEDSYYERELRSAQERLKELETMTDEAVVAQARYAQERVEDDNRRIEEERREKFARYDAMLGKVTAWKPPSEEHQAFKDFMIEQLNQSIEFDCRPYRMATPPMPASPDQWRAEKIAEQKERIERVAERRAENRERDDARRWWVETLLSSMPASTRQG